MTTVFDRKQLVETALIENNIPYCKGFLGSLMVTYADGYLTLADVMDQILSNTTNVSEDAMERMYTATLEAELEWSKPARVSWELLNMKTEDIPF